MSEAPGYPSAGDARSRRERGVAAYARIFAVADEELEPAFTARVGPVFAEEALQVAGGAAWYHPALTGRDRSIALITALVAQGVSGDRLATHVALARQHGLDDGALTALMTLLAAYLGLPRASLAMEVVNATATDGRRDGAT